MSAVEISTNCSNHREMVRLTAWIVRCITEKYIPTGYILTTKTCDHSWVLLLTYCQHSLHRQTRHLVGFLAAPLPFGTVSPHLFAPQTATLVLRRSSRSTCLQDICSRHTVRASDTLIRFFARYKFVTYGHTSWL